MDNLNTKTLGSSNAVDHDLEGIIKLNTKPAELEIPQLPGKKAPSKSKKKNVDKTEAVEGENFNLPKIDTKSPILTPQDNDMFSSIADNLHNRVSKPKPAAKSTPKPTKGESAPQSVNHNGIDSEVHETYEAVMRLKMYCQKFPDRISSTNKAKITKLDPDDDSLTMTELNKLISSCKIQVGSGGIDTIALPLFAGLLGSYEALAVRCGVKISGLTNLLMQDPQIKSLVDEILCEYWSLKYLKPEYRLLLIVLQSSYTLHRANQLMERRAELEKKKSAEKSAEKRDESPENLPVAQKIENFDNIGH